MDDERKTKLVNYIIYIFFTLHKHLYFYILHKTSEYSEKLYHPNQIIKHTIIIFMYYINCLAKLLNENNKMES